MENTNKIKVLESIGKIYETSKRFKLESSYFTKMDAELSFLSNYFQTTKIQSFFIANVYSLNYKGDSVDLSDLIRFFDCAPTRILQYSDDFKCLCESGIFEKRKLRFKSKLAGASFQYTVNEKITQAILMNECMPNVKEEKFTDLSELLEKLFNIGEQCYDYEITTQELFNQSRRLITNNLHIQFIRNVNHFAFAIEDTYLYLYVIWKTMSGDETTDTKRVLNVIYDNPTARLNYNQKLQSGENILLKNNFIEIVNATFFKNSELTLSENSINLLRECGINLIKDNKDKNKYIISPEEIPYRELIFCESEMQQLFMLKDLLSDAKFKETQQRLTNKNLPKGMPVLLHGTSGTGKTEIVKQLAKETNRQLLKVEISETKSKWFGESQKLVKQIFTDYHLYAKECERTPILLFNEADALFSMRKPIGNSNVAQTENALQNIILEELENFEGILVATTNLANNLDSAFERRFLFKIQFQKPKSSIRARIWKSKLPLLEFEDCGVLAERFAFSGGQIDNVLRKNEIYEIIHGKKVTLENLITLCEEETLTKQNVKVGFRKNSMNS